MNGQRIAYWAMVLCVLVFGAWVFQLTSQVAVQRAALRSHVESMIGMQAIQRRLHADDDAPAWATLAVELDTLAARCSGRPAKALKSARVAATRRSRAGVLAGLDEAVGATRRETAAISRTLGERWDSVAWVAYLALALAAGVLVLFRLVDGRGRALERAYLEVDRARLEAERANSSRATMLANISHEIRTPLSGVIGNASLLRAAGLPPERVRQVEAIEACGRTVVRALDDLIDLARLQSGSMTLRVASLSLSPLVEDALEIAAGTAAEKGLRLASIIDPHLPDRVLGDADRLRQVLGNLVGNAAKFTDHGIISIEVTELEDDVARFEVIDSGIGIPAHEAERIFDPFQQVAGGEGRPGGTGLGLTICRELVDRMGGKIGVQPGVRGGSVFWVELPLPTEGSRHRSSADPGLSGMRTAVVTDCELTWRAIDTRLRSWGVRGQRLGVDQLPASGVDVTILDLGVPGAEEILRLPSTGPLICLCLAGPGQRQPASRPDRQVVILPVRNTTLRSALRAVEGGARRVSESPSRPPSVRRRVLLADDDPLNREMTLSMLDALGIEGLAVRDGAEVLETVGRGFDLILLDCEMPNVDGYAACRALRKGPWPQVPILAMTAHALPENLRRCTEAGMDEVVTKPFTLDQLADALSRWLEEDGRQS